MSILSQEERYVAIDQCIAVLMSKNKGQECLVPKVKADELLEWYQSIDPDARIAFESDMTLMRSLLGYENKFMSFIR